ncbi:hypothetical protein [Nitrospirillum viridazoti]|uniref:hypothetical protein n=1 Tax=Nitrospirillum viridazoti TaxID=3144925 RepID=UPI00110F7414|nr:hypothetical protein [Nitrospirillum amazonense]
MTHSQRRYVVIETAIGVFISAAISILFVFVVFGGQDAIPLAGLGGVAFDALPQSFMIVFMSVLMPTVLTRRRIHSRTHLCINKIIRVSFPKNSFLRALYVAAPAAVTAWLFHISILPVVSPPEWRFFPLLFYKTVYGAFVSFVFVPVAIYVVMCEASATYSRSCVLTDTEVELNS